MRVSCTHCKTSYETDFLGLTKLSPTDKAIVKCVCDKDIEVSFVHTPRTNTYWQWHWNPFKWRISELVHDIDVKCQSS